MSELIHQITEVGAFRTDDTPPRLIVEVAGMARTAGWSNVRLERQNYLTPPEDGILEFDMVGDAPGDAAVEVLTDVTAEDSSESEDWIRGVRINGAINELEVDVIDDADDFGDDDDDDDGDDDADDEDDDADDSGDNADDSGDDADDDAEDEKPAQSAAPAA